VGLITQAEQANQIIEGGQADIILLAREFLRKPYWPLHAEQKLRGKAHAPIQYERAY
jgi:2,4-dienoyl-CoA reductase-like NADH-dependent reductase (Old Yellow Enzyme family)